MNPILLVEASEFEEREAEFTDADAGKRLDAALAERFPDLSRSRIQSILTGGFVSPVGVSKNTRVKPGDKVSIIVNDRIPLRAEPEEIGIDVVYEDEDVLVVDKERGMVVHPAKGNITGTLVNALLWRYTRETGGGLSSMNGQTRPGIVHRIDKYTSGLLVIAKNDASHANLADQFAAHTITRRYRAIVSGGFRDDMGQVEAPIGRDPKNRTKQAVVPAGKYALTRWRVLERLSGRYGVFTEIEAELQTGRTHQIRVHMAYAGHPVLGDDLYGPSRGPAANEGQYLHAGVLGFNHPATGERLTFESPPPGYYSEMLQKLGQ